VTSFHYEGRKALPAICRFPRRQRTTLPIQRMARLIRIPKVVSKTSCVYPQDALDGTTGLRDGRLGVRIPLRLRYFLLYNTFRPASEHIQAPLQLLTGKSGQSVKLTNHLHLVPWIPMSAALSLHGVHSDSFTFILEPPSVPSHHTQFDKDNLHLRHFQFTNSPNIITHRLSFG